VALPEIFSLEFWQKVAFSGNELSVVQGELNLKALGPWLGLAFWLILLSMPLSGIQRADRVTGATYVLFMFVGAVTITILFWRPWLDQTLDANFGGLLLFLSVMSIWRWQPRQSEAPYKIEKGAVP
jgi:hypothetical protein